MEIVEEIKNRMESIMVNYEQALKKIDEKAEKEKKKLENGSISKNLFEEQKKGFEQEKKRKQEKYSEQLDKAYNQGKEQIKELVGYGDSGAADTTSILSQANSLTTTDIQIIVDRWTEEGNYLGLQGIRKVAKEKGVTVQLDGAERQLSDLDFNYEGKDSVLKSTEALSSMDRMRKVADLNY